MEQNEDDFLPTEDIFQSLPQEQRKQAMIDNGCKVETTIVNRPFTEGELSEFKDTLSEEMIALNKIEQELKAIKDEFKIKMKPLQTRVSELLVDLRLKYRESMEEVYMLADYPAGTMNTYDIEGKFIASRKLYPQERQHKILPITKTGTNN